MHAKRFNPIAALLIAFLAVLGVTACEPAPYVGTPDAPRIAVVGDSLVAGLNGDYTNRLTSRGWNASVTGIGGMTSRDHWDTLQRIMPSNPDVVLIALGTNDIREVNAGLQTWDGFRDSVRYSLEITRAAPCVAWVGVNEVNGFYGPGIGDLSQIGWVVNNIIQQELQRSGRAAGTTFYGSWADASRNHLEYFLGPGNVHFTPAGNVAYMNVLDQAISQCPRQPIMGNLDAVTTATGRIQLSGWLMRTAGSDSIDIIASLDGRDSIYKANLSRPDIAAAFGRGDRHGFAATLLATPGAHQVCVRDAASVRSLGCRTVTVPSPPPSSTTTTTVKTTTAPTTNVRTSA